MDEDLHKLIHLLINVKKLYDEACHLVNKLNNKDTLREMHEQAIKKMLTERRK